MKGINLSARFVRLIVFIPLFAGLLLLPSTQATGQTTIIWSEDFTGETGSSTSVLTGDQWTATETTSPQSGTMSITSGEFLFAAGGANTDYGCSWVSDEIDIAGFTGITVSYSSSGNGGNPNTVSLSMTNGTLDNGAFTPDAGATTTVLTFSFLVKKNKSRTLDDITLTGTSSCTPTTWYADADGDGLGDANTSQSACDQPTDFVANSTDNCDNTLACNYAEAGNPACTYPALWYADTDGDGFGNPASSQTSCSQPAGYIADNSDCDDSDSNVTTATSTWYDDSDGDGLGDPAVSQVACSQPAGYVDNNTDDDPNLNSSDFTGTVLYPGDVYFSFAADTYSGIADDYVGFTVLKDIAAGTQIMLAPEWDWTGTSWDGSFSGTLIRWTAPSEGVTAGTEVILFDIDNASSSGEAKCDDDNNPITRSGDNSTLQGGKSCGSYEHLLTGRKEFNWQTRWSWIFQPNISWDLEYSLGYANATAGSVTRHLSCIGYDLNYDNNTGSGTLISGSDWEANMNSAYTYQDASFYQSSCWTYSGGSTVLPFTESTVNGNAALQPRNLADGTSFSAANGATPAYTITDNTYAEIPDDPNGCIAFPTTVGWDALANGPGAALSAGNASGAQTLNISVDNDINLSIDVMGGVSCNDITVTTGAFAACDGMGRELSVSGDIALGATSTFDGGAGTLKMAGLTLQTLDANNYGDPTSTKVQLNNLQVLKNKVTKVSGHVRMKPGGAMTFDDLAVNDELALDTENASSITFESNAASGTSGIGPCAASNFANGTSQEFTFQRYIPADTDGSTWVNIGAYVTGTTVSDWTAANPSMLIFKYMESNYGSIGAGWSYLWDGTTELTPGSGYMALIPQSQDALISVTGAFQIGDVDIDLTFTDDPNQSNSTVDGWNLVSNPYPSAVDLAQVISRVDGVEAFYIYDNTGAGGYTTVNENGVGGSDTLDVGQSFWVKVSANKTLTFQESDKVTGSNTFIRELPETFEGSIGVHIANETANQWSKAFIQFDTEATVAFDENEDAVFYGDPAPGKLNAWTVAETGQKLSIQTAGSVATTPSLPLHVTTGAGGTLRISGITDADTPSDICAVVEDLETGERAQLGRDVLEVNVPANTTYTDRFIVHFTPEPSMTWESTVCNGLDVTMSGEAWESWDASWSANDGSSSGTGMPYELEDGDYTFEFSLPAAGCVQSVDVTVETACLGDFNLNGERDVVDLLVLLSGLPTGALESEFAVEADCDCDGAVTVNDMLTFLTVFGTDCD